MNQKFQKIVLILFLIAVTLPMAFLLVVALGDVTISITDSPWLQLLKQISFIIAVFWLLDLVLLVLTLALKDLVREGFLQQKWTNDTDMDDEFDQIINP